MILVGNGVGVGELVGVRVWDGVDVSVGVWIEVGDNVGLNDCPGPHPEIRESKLTISMILSLHRINLCCSKKSPG